MNHIRVNALLLAACSLLPASARAGAFRAVPVRLFIEGKTKTAVLRIMNEGDEKVTIQIDAKRWTQKDGQDVYEDTPDIVFFPKIADVEKGEERIIRVGYTGSAGTEEKTYRIFVQELPVKKPGEMALKFALNLGIPVFIKPQKALVDWSAEAAGLSEETLKLKVTNAGNSHILVTKIKSVGLDAAGTQVFSREAAGWYTLAAGSSVYPVPVPRQDCLKVKTIKLDVAVEKTTKQAHLVVDPAMCTPKPEPAKKQDRGLPLH